MTIQTLFPFWVAYVAPTYIAASSFLATALVGRLAVRLAIPRGGPREWPEGGRDVAVARHLLFLISVIGPLLAGVLAALFVGPLSVVGPYGGAGLGAVGAYLGSMTARYRLAVRIYGAELNAATWFRGLTIQWLVMSPVLIATAVLAISLPDHLDSHAVAIFAIGAVVLVVLASGIPFLLLRPMGLAAGADDRLRRLASAAESRVGVAPRRIICLRSPVANAFALPTIGLIGVTDAAMVLLDDPAMESVLAHELAHLRQGRFVTVTRMAAVLVLLAAASGRPVIGSCGMGAYLGLFAASIVLFVVAARVARREEVRSDAVASRDGEDAGAYARALEIIYRTNLLPAVDWKRRVHPHLYDRMLAAGVTPQFERPPGPSLRRYHAIGAPLTILLLVLLSAVWLVPIALAMGAGRDERSLIALAALTGGTDGDLANLAMRRFDARDLPSSLALYRAAVAREPGWFAHHANEAIVLCHMGRCEEAKRVLTIAERLAPRHRGLGDTPLALVAARRAVAACELHESLRKASDHVGQDD